MIAGRDNHAHLQAVQTGIRSSDETQILSGVKAGQQVVTTGAYGLPDNAQVKIEQPAEPPQKQPAKSDPGKGKSD